MSTTPSYDDLLKPRRGKGGPSKPSEFSLKLAALEEGEVLHVGENSTKLRNRASNSLHGIASYIRRHYPERKFRTRVHDGQLYIIRLRAEDINRIT